MVKCAGGGVLVNATFPGRKANVGFQPLAYLTKRAWSRTLSTAAAGSPSVSMR